VLLALPLLYAPELATPMHHHQHDHHTLPPRSTTIAPVKLARASATLSAIRSQAAFVRTLLDEVERTTAASSAAARLDESHLSAQLVEELARLGCSFIEVASGLTSVVDECEKIVKGGGDGGESIVLARCG
jgi:hypothetical protein